MFPHKTPGRSQSGVRRERRRAAPSSWFRRVVDPSCTAAMFDDLAARAVRPTLVELEGVGHFSALEAPDDLAAVLLEFHRDAAR